MPKKRPHPASPPSKPPVSISFIMPTLGRETLVPMLELLAKEIAPQDEVLVYGDGPQELAKSTCARLGPQFHYDHTTGPPGFGCIQRDLALTRAKGQFIAYVDDDDTIIPGVIRPVIHPHLARHPKSVHFFRIVGHPAFPGEWHRVGGTMIMHPNNPALTPSWAKSGTDCLPISCDTKFLESMRRLYENDGAFIWHHDISWYIQRPHLGGDGLEHILTTGEQPLPLHWQITLANNFKARNWQQVNRIVDDAWREWCTAKPHMIPTTGARIHAW